MVIGHENPTNPATHKVATYPLPRRQRELQAYWLSKIPTELLSIETGHRILHGAACGLELLKENETNEGKNDWQLIGPCVLWPEAYTLTISG
jgi:hypothetical protein